MTHNQYADAILREALAMIRDYLDEKNEENVPSKEPYAPEANNECNR